MSTISFAKKVQNDMEMIEMESDRHIEQTKYYLIHLHDSNLDSESVKVYGKTLLANNQEHIPLAVYIFDTHIYLIFSCVDPESKHYQNGSQQKIISEYVSYASLKLNSANISCKIVEFATQTQVITYFTWKIYNNSKNYISSLLKKEIDKTIMESIEELKKNGIIWDEILPENKYGSFYKLKKMNDKIYISTLSEYFDANNFQKYINYIFGNSS